MTRKSNLVLVVQNLDYSGANTGLSLTYYFLFVNSLMNLHIVALNIVSSRVHTSSLIVLSPTSGAFLSRFVSIGASIRIGDVSSLLLEISDICCVICNTIMTASSVVMARKLYFPCVYILHEW